MGTGKSQFRITINTPKEEVNLVIQRFLNANNFSPHQYGNIIYHISNKYGVQRNFEYYLNDYELVILAYTGTFEAPNSLEGINTNIPVQEYRNDLTLLFRELDKLVQGGQNWCNQTPYGGTMNNTGYSDNVNTNDVFVQRNEQRKEWLALFGFVLAVMSLLLSFTGSRVGLLVVLFIFWCASQGLASKRGGFAKATFILSIISIFVMAIMA